MHDDSGLRYYEFFAGGGLARLGLGSQWRCLWANDVDPRKAAAYRQAFGADALLQADVARVEPSGLPGVADLAWASFPCQDLSLAGPRTGLHGARSGLFWAFWRLLEGLDREGRGPELIVLENVRGLAAKRSHADFAALVEALTRSGRWTGCLEIDARRFLPQSRPRLFFVASRSAPGWALGPSPWAGSDSLAKAVAALSPAAASRWVSWRLPEPPAPNAALADLLEPDDAVVWDAPAKTAHILALLAPGGADSVEAKRRSGERCVGALFRRMRPLEGRSVQRAEVRFDGLAGCLRTPAGGSSRQALLVIGDGAIRTRQLTGREAARLMGVPDHHPLPARESDALKLLGDAVAVPVVSWLSTHLLSPLAREARRRPVAA